MLSKSLKSCLVPNFNLQASKIFKSVSRFHTTLFFMVMVCMLSFSCTSKYYRDFDLVDQDYRFDPDSIVVLPGSLREQDLLLASSISDHLKKNSSFKVTTFNDVEQRIPDYKHILVDFDVPDFEKDKTNVYYLSKQNLNQVNAVNKEFKSKYVYVVWTSPLMQKITTNQNGASSSDYRVEVYGRLLEYPKSRIIGYSINKYWASENKGFFSFFNVFNWFKSENDQIVDFFKNCGKIIGNEIIRVSK